MFERLAWHKDRMVLDDLVFRLQHYLSDDWELGEDCFVFYKIKKLIDQYERFFAARGTASPQNVFELGLWDGGSLAFWFQLFQPKKHVGIDLRRRSDSKYFQRYVSSRGLQRRITTRWGVDQADAKTLREIIGHEFDGALDLVIDDASHLYEPTRASFECLFPLLRPGGLYIIEDWAWGHWPEFHATMSKETPLTGLVFELVEATGSSATLARSLTIYEGFVVVERGEAELPRDGAFRLEHHICRRPTRSIAADAVNKFVSFFRPS